jgi:hypothetical protein
MSQFTDKISNLFRKSKDTASDGYRKASRNVGSGRKVDLKRTSGFSHDAKTVMRESERMKDDALRDVDRRFG